MALDKFEKQSSEVGLAGRLTVPGDGMEFDEHVDHFLEGQQVLLSQLERVLPL